MKIKRNRVILTMILLGVVMTLFSAALNTMSYRKLQADTVVHSGVLNTTSAVRKMNYALSFGKPINKFYGLTDIMEGIAALSADIIGVEVTDSKRERVEAIGDIDEPVRRTTPDEEYVIRSDGLYAFVDFDGGEMILKFDKESVEAATREYLEYIARVSLAVMLTVIIAAFASCFILGGEELTVKRMRITAIVILVASQCLLGTFSMMKVSSAFDTSLDKIAIMTARSVENDINEVINKGVDYDEFTGLEEYLEDLSLNIPEISSMEIMTEAGSDGDENKCINIDVQNKDGINLNCNYSIDYINRKKINNAIDIIILILIAIFMSLETIKFLTNHIEYRDNRREKELYIPGFRLFVFAEGIAFALDSGFFSVFSNKMFDAMNLPESMSFLGGMPNTMFSVAVLIGLFGCGTLINRFGMKKTLIAGIVAGILGYILCAFSPNLPFLIVSRFIFGFCDGIIVNAIRLYAASQKNQEMHNRLLVEYMAAINLGVCCGVVIGGLIADVASYAVVFLVGAAIGCLCLFLIFIAHFPEKQENEKGISFFEAVKELRIPQVSIFMIFVVIPLYMASLFVEYTFPLFGDEMNFSNSMVAGLLMVNFMIIAYLTDPISEWVTKRMRTRPAMFLYMLFQTLSIGLFVLTSSIWAAILAIIFTSLWDCFGMVVIDSGLDHVEGTVTEQSTLLQMVFGKIAIGIGPIAITSRLNKGAANATGIIVVALVIGLVVYGAAILYFKSKDNRAKEVADNENKK
ncbi:Predicted arabinose efflux permease, MFS family [Butyrivibrio sp. ob235]|uniref:MFS transporter n=1 Tax=Butyrivibrio sp. ob235 TaxID=1761780 RepID=UPI0008D72A92|nr:MFS transporter [Butyrivibrio sp. ob235]SEL21112.1 Predicted arabinose efflux permease, MFS family [Butyrivibrio sp. ob235]